jgi:DNA gyrase subunit A
MSESISVSLTSELVSDFLTYTTAIYNRALPDIVDGLKVAQRRAILGLKDLSLTSNSQYCKVSRLEGHVLGKYHPQGGCSGTIINLGQQSSTRYTLTDIHGNVGGSIQTGPAIGQLISEDEAAAARYLEVRSTALVERVYLTDLDRTLGDWRSNYDDSTTEPVRMVPSLPALLITGAQGIASGYACYHLPYRISDVVNATRAFIKNKNITDKQLLSKFSSPPEFAQGGRVDKNSCKLSEVILHGKGQVEVWGEWSVEEKFAWKKKSTRPALIITRLAYGSSEKFLEKVRDLADSGRLQNLVDASDHSSREGIRIVLVAKTPEDIKGCILPALLSSTGLKHTYNINCTTVGVDGKPVLTGVREVIRSWYGERVKYVISRNKKLKESLQLEIDKLSGVQTILSDVDRFIKLVRKAKDSESAIAQIEKIWKLSRVVSQHLLSIPIRTLIATESGKVSERLNTLQSELSSVEKLCAAGPDLDNHIISSMPSEKQLEFTPRCVWAELSQSETVVEKPPTLKEKIFSEGKTLGMTSRGLNKWIRTNTGTGKIMENWEKYKAELKTASKKSARVRKTSAAKRCQVESSTSPPTKRKRL